MDTVSVLIEILKSRDVITPLEQDILDTYNELNKKPFDRESVIRQCQKNNINHPDIFVAISTSPTTVFKPWADATNEDVYSNLTNQLGALVRKEMEVVNGAQQT